MPKRVHGFLAEYARMWPREVLEIPELLKLVKPILNRPGVYVLYIDENPYYIGQAANRLWNRLHTHAWESKGKYYNFWNFFCAFAMPKEYVDQAEAMLIASVPTANSSKPRISSILLPPRARKLVKEARMRAKGYGPPTE